MPTGTWDRLREDRRTAVLDAAEAEFAARGFSQGSLNTICREAGVSKGSLFQYFADKADMYVHIAELASLRIRAAMEAEIAALDWQDDFFGSMQTLVEAWVRYFYAHPRDLAMTAAANLEPDTLARTVVRAAVNRHYLAVLRPIVETAAEAGQLRDDADLDALLSLLLIVLPHVALAPHIPGLDPVMGMEEGRVEHAVVAAQRLLSVLLHSYRPESGR
jgi:AcrR family transcriptional regulator